MNIVVGYGEGSSAQKRINFILLHRYIGQMKKKLLNRYPAVLYVIKIKMNNNDRYYLLQTLQQGRSKFTYFFVFVINYAYSSLYTIDTAKNSCWWIYYCYIFDFSEFSKIASYVYLHVYIIIIWWCINDEDQSIDILYANCKQHFTVIPTYCRRSVGPNGGVFHRQ